MTACSSDSTDVAATTTVATPGQSTTTIATTLPPYQSPLGDIVGEALTAGVFTTLAGLLVDAGLVQALRATGPFTVFAPTDDAFKAVPAATMDAVFADAQVKHLNAAVAVEHPTLGTLSILNQAIKLSRTPGAVVTATPERGEHSDEILGEIGLSATDVADLRASGAIR
jgi:hypothetical protein